VPCLPSARLRFRVTDTSLGPILRRAAEGRMARRMRRTRRTKSFKFCALRSLHSGRPWNARNKAISRPDPESGREISEHFNGRFSDASSRVRRTGVGREAPDTVPDTGRSSQVTQGHHPSPRPPRITVIQGCMRLRLLPTRHATFPRPCLTRPASRSDTWGVTDSRRQPHA
jgi:hypothetical protein